MAVRSASGAASEHATNKLGHAVTRWIITLARFDQSARALGDPSAALPVATALLGPERPSKDDVYVAFASVILFGDQVLDQLAPWTWAAGRSRTETGRLTRWDLGRTLPAVGHSGWVALNAST